MSRGDVSRRIHISLDHPAMPTPSSPAAIVKAVRLSHDRIMTWTGVIIGIVLLAYFFSFAQLLDRGYLGLAWFQAITSVALVIGLFMLKRVSFAILKLLHGRRPAYRPLLDVMTVADLDKDDETLLKRFAATHPGAR